VLGPAQSALLTVMLPADLLPDANAALNTVQQALRLLGPLAGAGLFVALGAHLIAILDSATFAIAVLSLVLLRVREPVPQLTHERWSRRVMAGVHHIWQTLELRQAVIAGACTTVVFGFSEAIAYAIVGQGLHKPAAFVGVLAAIQGAGAVAGGLSAAALVRRLREGRLMGIAMLLAATGAVLQVPALLPIVLIGEVLFGAAIPWLIVSLITLSQRLTPPDLQGRVYAAAETLITTPQTISIAVVAGLITVTGYRPLLTAMAAIFTLTATYLLTRRAPHGSRHPRAMRASNGWSGTG
jgi:Na+/melibiose symporter-like transporter